MTQADGNDLGSDNFGVGIEDGNSLPTIIKRETAEKLADLTFKLLTRCQEKEDNLAKLYELTPAEFRCLRHIHANENINNKVMSERMQLSASRLTRIIDGLVKKGYVNREIEPNDRRNMRVYLSAKGLNFVTTLNEAYVKIHEDILTEVDPVLQVHLINGMTNFLAAVENWLEKDGIESYR
ncbi:MAG: hypothetical protein C0425_06650 [Chlorobiaceae bacterium]|nr:hypothetical protein [Chlorobiaceae bacterium]MBA4310000.1 hypothetical protein [Chlorobiaceae bacterium]